MSVLRSVVRLAIGLALFTALIFSIQATLLPRAMVKDGQ